MIKPASEALAIHYEEDTLTSDYVSDHAKNYDRTTKAFRQCTLKHAVQAVGKGRYRGESVILRLTPAPIYTGIVFRRVDINPMMTLKTDLAYVQSTAQQTNLLKQGVAVDGIGPFISVLAGLGIDNLYIDIDRPELPMMDGSAEPFVFLIQSAGLKQQSGLKRFVRIRKKVQVSTNAGWVVIEPGPTLEVTAMRSNQQYSTTLSASTYAKSLSRARKGVENMPASHRRYENEYIRHHMVEIIGDLYAMLGCSVLGSFRSYNTDHMLNYRLICKLFADAQAWESIEYPSRSAIAPIYY
jgi:UDP-3-O-[3-hydroxymyristoyl] N-acetylglucosamine deacetylase